MIFPAAHIRFGGFILFSYREAAADGVQHNAAAEIGGDTLVGNSFQAPCGDAFCH